MFVVRGGAGPDLGAISGGLVQSVEVGQHIPDKLLTARVIGGWRFGEEHEQITRLLDRLVPGHGRFCEQH